MRNTPCTNSAGNQRRLALALSVFMLLLGVLYYVLYRQHALATQIMAVLPGGSAGVLQAPELLDVTWFPSLAHAFATVLCLHALVTGWYSSLLRVRLSVVAALVVLELALGTVDGLDLIAIAAGVVLAEVTAWQLGLCLGFDAGVRPAAHRYARLTAKRLAVGTVVSGSALLAAGSYTEGYYTECAVFDDSGLCTEYKQAAVPVYMSYQQLRDAVRIEVPRAPDRLGRVYLYQNYVFLNERNEGIHIIDNSDPANPVNQGFIRIPGNTEIAIRDKFLYADSYVDLITLDLNDAANIQLVNRQQDIFPYDAAQSIPYNVSLSRADLDPQRGVIVSYQLTGN